ncbi:Stk1 family PASTA domain-containing Ser/Thr kinase [[Eubacterium] rectale]|uniref:Stk1 family PASTA domain-containing Ser/Thr kinase n=1 Tax=Agathobacter rectalis TaxID=39491 RepID=UPI0027D33E5B|nr:Stk1 family PASTA domain-containing Ser/Thr kinase [Agathobacter rectalis]MBT9696627.1 Stk1 family PASTA domain-containing Ser/Thr kinase [Agathobacter rectalis]
MLEIGSFLSDRYEILSKVGAGGMSDVYKAKDHILSRFVAIKVLKQEFSEDSSFVTKFRAEAQSAAGLEHPNIVNIYDVGSENGLYYIVMEYVEGITLKTYIEKKGQLSFKESASIAIQVARGIEAAHNKNIIHRDIKPQNIIISTDGKVKVTDFGIAKATSSNTISSDVMGSVHYASPEQARNGFVDGRSDIYSLGIVMFEMVTGRVPFDGDTTVAVALQHLQEEIARPSIYAPDLPISFEKIILKCTQKTPDRRYQTIEELLTDIRRSLAHPDEDFVTIAPLVDGGKTKVISPDELDKIKEGRGVAEDLNDDDTDADNDDEYADGEDDDDEYDESLLDDDDDEDDDDDGKLLNPKMDKAITIMGIVTAVIIVIVIIYLALSVAGVFKFGGKKNSESQQTESQTQTESESESETQTETEGQMIDIRGMSVDDAQKAVDRLKLDLTVFAFETKQSDEKDGTILEQDVKGGDTVKRGSQINVVIAGKGDSTSEMVKVPSVIGKTKSSAKSTLESAGFSVTFEYGDYNNSVAADVVTAQSPSAKKQAAKGSTVTVTLSPGQKPITVPNVVGASQSQAESALAGAGLKYTYADSQYSDTVPAGSVISQTKSGETVAAGTTITLTLSKGKQEISTNVSKGISYSGEGTVVKAEYKLVGKSGTVYDKGSYENTSSFTVSGTMKEATGSIVVTWTVQTGETDEAGNPATVTLDPVTYSVP